MQRLNMSVELDWDVISPSSHAFDMKRVLEHLKKREWSVTALSVNFSKSPALELSI